MRRMIAFVAIAAATGLVVGGLVFGGSAGAATKALAVAEQNNPAFSPFQTTVTPKSGFCQTIDVPAGKRLVIEYISANVEDATLNNMTIQTTAGGSTVAHYFLLTPPPETSTISIGSQAVRLYADPSTQVSVCVAGLGVVSLTGYLVQLP
jgi:hypothetical protein